jgi:hypothetical protein
MCMFEPVDPREPVRQILSDSNAGETMRQRESRRLMRSGRVARGALSAIAVAAVAACGPHTTRSTPNAAVMSPARFLYVWAGDKDEKESDFLAVVDVRRESPTYGQVLNTVPVGMTGTLPHHLEYSLPAPGQTLFANGHHHEQIFRFDISDAEHPRLVGVAANAAPLRYPHDFARLPDNSLLVGYLRSDGKSPTPGDTIMPGNHGGIAHMSPDGRLLSETSAADPSLNEPMRAYAFAVLPSIDRFVVTSAPMMEDYSADVIQIWRLSDLKLLETLPVPPAELPDGRVLAMGHTYPFEPRVMADGSVLLSTYGCGFYRVTNIATRPELHNVYTIDIPVDRVPADRRAACGVPVVSGHYWVMSVGKLNMLVALDIADPEHPREVSRLLADSTFRPHWMAKDPGSDRIIVGAENGGENRMLMARLEERTGKLSWDETFRSAGGALGVSFVRTRWPHGDSGEAFGHAALFRP